METSTDQRACKPRPMRLKRMCWKPRLDSLAQLSRPSSEEAPQTRTNTQRLSPARNRNSKKAKVFNNKVYCPLSTDASAERQRPTHLSSVFHCCSTKCSFMCSCVHQFCLSYVSFFFEGHANIQKAQTFNMFTNVPQRTRQTSQIPQCTGHGGGGGEGKGLFRSYCAQRRGRRDGSALSYTLEESAWCFLLYQTTRGPFGSLFFLLKRFLNQSFDQKKAKKESSRFADSLNLCWYVGEGQNGYQCGDAC